MFEWWELGFFNDEWIMDEILCVCDVKVGNCVVSNLIGISKVVDLISCDVVEVRWFEILINFDWF